MTTQAPVELRNGDRRDDDRRNPSDRRSANDRRKATEQPCVAIEIGESMLHIVTIVRRAGCENIATVDSVEWRKSSDGLLAEHGEAELLAALRQVVAEQRLVGSPLRVALGGNLCVTRALVGSRDDVNRELQELRERSRLYLTLGSGPKAVASSVTPLDARHQHALLSVAGQTTLDIVSRVVDACGLVLTNIESSQVAVCRLLGNDPELTEQTVLLLQADQQQLHIAAVRDGRLLIDYRPSGGATAQQTEELLTQHYERLVRYCQRHYGQAAAQISRIINFADADLANGSQRMAMSGLKLPIEVANLGRVKLPWKWSGGTPGAESAVALGAALGGIDADVVQFPNLAECVLDVSRPPVLGPLAKLLSPIAACLLLAVGLSLLNYRTAQQVAVLRSEVDLLAPVVARSERLRRELLDGRQELTYLTHLSEKMPEDSWHQLIGGIGACMPEDVWLHALTLSDLDHVALRGSSYSESGVYDFVGHLQHMPATNDVALLGTTTATNRGAVMTNFDIDIALAGLKDDDTKDAQASNKETVQ